MRLLLFVVDLKNNIVIDTNKFWLKYNPPTKLLHKIVGNMKWM